MYPKNITVKLSIDEVCLSKGELCTIVTSKADKGKENTIVVIVKGTKSETVVEHLLKLSKYRRNKVKEITLDMAGSMKQIAKRCSVNATQVIDRFHVQKLASEALQNIRIKHRWIEMDNENNAIIHAKGINKTYSPDTLSNGDTKKQLLARSRHLLYKSHNKWTIDQQNRAKLLFELYPEIEQGDSLTNNLKAIYNKLIPKEIDMTKLAYWFNQVENTNLKQFNTVIKTFMVHY